MSEDLQGNRWWLASDGRWYPPDLHPDVRAARPDEQDRNKALLNATIGVAQVRERVFADVLGERRGGHGSPRGTDEASPDTTGTRDSDQRPGSPRGHDPMPRFRGHDSSGSPETTRAPDPAAAGPEPRWSPETENAIKPPARSSSWVERAEAEPAGRKAPGASVTGVLPVTPVSGLARWQQGTSTEPAVPQPRVALSPSPSETEAPPTPPPPWQPGRGLGELASPPPPGFLAEVRVVEASLLLESLTPLPPPPPEGAVHKGRVVPPSGRRRPSKAHSTADLRDAVAGAVARAAAQGPLMPHSTDEEDEEAGATPASDRSALWTDSPADQAELDEASSALVVPQGPDSNEEPVYGPPSPAALDDGGPKSENRALLDETAASGPDPERSDSEVLVREEPEGPGLEGPFLDEVTAAHEVAFEQVTLEAVPAADEAESGQGPLAEQDVSEPMVPPDPLLLALLVEDVEESPVPPDPLLEDLLIKDVAAPVPSVYGPAVPEPAGEGEAPENPAQQSDDITPEASDWAFGERRSAARQARKPLPAALQEAVTAGAAQDLDEAGSTGAPGQASDSERALRQAKDSRGKSGKNPDSSKRPGIVRRYGSAIVILVLFLAAGGVAAGIAAFRGPVNPPAPSTVAQDQAAANAAVLTTAQFPPSWQVSPTRGVSSYGLGSVLLTPSLVRAWLAANRACKADLDAVTAAMTPSLGNVTAVAWSQATTTNPLGGPWQIADAVSFHTSAAQVSADVARMRSVLAGAKAQQCVARFWSASLQAQVPASSVVCTVSPRSLPPLSGTSSGWSMEMTGTETAGQSSSPLRFEMTSFAVGRAQMFFITSSEGAALPANIAKTALDDLARRTEHLGAQTA